MNKVTNMAAIFDMDGVLFDSVVLNWRAINRVLEPYGAHVADDEIKRYLGRTLRDQVTILNETYGLALDYDSFNAATQTIKDRLFALLAPKEGVRKLLKALKSGSIPTAVATSMPRELTEQRLRNARILDCFDSLVTEHDVTKHKPDPEVFIKAAEALNTGVSRCIVFEDAPTGVAAAKAAGMKCIAVQTSYVAWQDLSDADLQVSSLTEVTVSQLAQLLAH